MPRSRGIDYLENLGPDAAALTCLVTLKFELLQNADDADADALMVFSSAVFSDFGDQDLPPERVPVPGVAPPSVRLPQLPGRGQR